MRLHQLSVTAFGPFVDTVEVDFDALCDGGLFLLSGPTGAGKSSVLDAVCFALYGAVPGDRQQAGRLRSDQAPPALAPSVTLEVGLSGRRFRIVRSPAWDRPKRRGTGTTREQARVSVSELVADTWTPLTSRLDEAGDLLSGLLGMNLDQFCQVVLLPQGQFQAFLRADSTARHQLLSRLFRTGRFERVEAWLRDQRVALRRSSEAHGQGVADLVSRLSEVASTPPSPVAGSTTTLESAPATVEVWSAGVLTDAAARRTSTEEALAGAVDAEARARDGRDRALALAAARSRVVEAAAVVERLEETAAARTAERERLERARRVRGLHALVRLADERRAALELLAREEASSRAEVQHVGLDPDDLETELERVGEQLARLTALRPAERRLGELRDRASATSRSLANLESDAGLADAEAQALTAHLRELEGAAADDEVTPAVVVSAEHDAEAAATAADAHARLARLVPEREAVVAEHTAAVHRLLDARERLLDLRERRIAGMAAELAVGLVVGDDCPVCGSAEHPRPATRVAGHPDADAERAAQHAVDDAQVTEHALDLRRRELDTAISTSTAAAGPGDIAAAAERLDTARGRLTALRARVDDRSLVLEELADARRRSAELGEASAERRVRRAELVTALEHVGAEIESLTARLAAARGEHAAIDAAVAELELRRELVRGADSDRARAASAATGLADAETALAVAAAEAGFAGAAAVREAQVSPTELAALEERVREHDATLAAARRVLDEPGSARLLAAPDPDVEGGEQRAHAAVEHLERCRAADEHAVRVLDRVRRLTQELHAALAAWAPVRDQLALATRVAAFAEGKAPDNRLQMRLSAYVLAYRLTQVVAAANARLAGISDRRYALEHVGERGAGERRGGLSLLVRDDWSGESRDPATLSGGETFVVSLALALGLADVVAHEAGGTELQTLFVDEGFGALDAETLDDVLDVLDTLRENGRAVGVVSHVAEMRDRIPTQLLVAKAPAGSTVRVVG